MQGRCVVKCQMSKMGVDVSITSVATLSDLDIY